MPLSTSDIDVKPQRESIPKGQVQPFESASAPLGTSPQRNARSSHRKKNMLSCFNCRQKKVKCDKADPCSRCARVGALCVSSPPSGAPRGRKGGRHKVNHNLLDRIANLENLVNGIKGRYSGETSGVAAPANENRIAPEESELSAPMVKPPKSSPTVSKEGLGRYLGSSVWMSLSDEFHGIYELLNQPSDDEDDDDVLTPDSSPLSSGNPSESSCIICDPRILYDIDYLQHPNRSQVQSLHSSFMTNVDPVVKILHGPSLQRYLIEQTAEFDCSPGPKGWKALEFAIYYSSTTSLTAEECLELLGEERGVLLHRFRFGTELALARADFINTVDMSTLQALVLYLYALRSNETSRRTWTLASLAVRIAHALGLHRETYSEKYPSPYQPFEREMRRRLWWQICNLDRHASVDRGSDPIITPKSFSTQLPLNVNDKDLIPGDPREVQPRNEYTDFTISLVIHEVFDIERRLNYVLAGESDHSHERADEPWDMRRYWGLVCQQRIKDKYLQHCNVTVPIQRYTIMLADAVFATLRLWIYSPLQRPRYYQNMATIPRSWILHTSLEVVEKINKVLVDPSARPFKWLTTIWISWHALAVMIAELCVQTEGPLVERAWALVDVVFEETAQHIADSNQGKLWRPIKKLMNKAEAVRKKHLEDSTSIPGPLLPNGDSGLANQIPLPNTQFVDLEVIGLEGGSNVLDEISERAQWPQQNVNATEPISVGWDPWAATEWLHQMDYNNDLNPIAWTHLESFIDDLRADGGLLPGEESGVLPLFRMW